MIFERGFVFLKDIFYSEVRNKKNRVRVRRPRGEVVERTWVRSSQVHEREEYQALYEHLID